MASPESYAFPKYLKVRKRREYLLIGKRGKQYFGQALIVDSLKVSGQTVTRCGITVSRHYGKAHERNRFKRLVREAFRHTFHLLPPGYSLNVKPRKSKNGSTLEQMCKDLQKALS